MSEPSILSEVLAIVVNAGIISGLPVALWHFIRERNTANKERLLARLRQTADVAAGDAYLAMAMNRSTLTDEKLALGKTVGTAYIAKAVPQTLAALARFGETPNLDAMVRARIGELLAADPNVSLFRAPETTPQEPIIPPPDNTAKNAEVFREMVASPPPQPQVQPNPGFDSLDLSRFSVKQ